MKPESDDPRIALGPQGDRNLGGPVREKPVSFPLGLALSTGVGAVIVSLVVAVAAAMTGTKP